MKKIFSILIIILSVGFVFFAGSIARADPVDVQQSAGSSASKLKKDIFGQLHAGAETSGLRVKEKGDVDIRIAIATTIRAILAPYGIIFVTLVFIAGWNLLTAQGEEEKIQKAYKIIIGATIGLFILLSSYAIANFLGKKAVQVTGYGVSFIQIDLDNQV